MIEPTPGRIVWFTPSTDDKILTHYDHAKPLAAIVCHVWGNRCVNLLVIDSAGIMHAKTSVPLLQDDEEVPVFGHFCAWMPYQKGQAAKHDTANALATASPASEDVYLRRWAVETAMQAARDHVSGAREDVQAYAEKLRAWVSGAAK